MIILFGNTKIYMNIIFSMLIIYYLGYYVILVVRICYKGLCELEMIMD